MIETQVEYLEAALLDVNNKIDNTFEIALDNGLLSTPAVAKFKSRLKSISTERVRKLRDRLRRKVSLWEKLLSKALSTNGNPFRNKPRPRDRQFPFRISGALRDSIRTELKYRSYKTGTITISVWADIVSPHATVTNLGIPKPKDLSQGAWVGWKNDVLFGSGRGAIPSINDVFAEISTVKAT